jgi:hypothetical protein
LTDSSFHPPRIVVALQYVAVQRESFKHVRTSVQNRRGRAPARSGCVTRHQPE